jgi:prepilin-type N-terminal cleavage/methylation domain-containing protein
VKRRSPSARSRGFSLVEIMVSLGIVSVLSSVAIPEFSRFQMRSKAAERATMMGAVSRSLADVVVLQQRTPASGGWNPIGAPGPHRRTMDWTQPGWNEIPLLVDGGIYYSYRFDVTPGAPGAPVAVDVYGQGDLDGDGALSTRLMSYLSAIDGLNLVSDGLLDPPENL